MILKPLRIPANQEIFDVHLKNFLSLGWSRIVLKHQLTGKYRHRYDLLFPKDPIPYYSGKKFCQIDTLPLSKNRIEVIFCAIQLQKGYFYRPFFIKIYKAIYRKWFPNRSIPTNMDPIRDRIWDLKISVEIPLDISLFDKTDDPELEAKLNMCWKAIDKTFPSLDTYENSGLQTARPSYLPKRRKTLDNWIKMYAIVVR